MIISNFPGGGGGKPVKKTFNECTWAEISQVCRAGYAAEYWAIGDTKMMVNGDTGSTVRIIGFDHDYVEDSESYGRAKAGITLRMVYAIDALKQPMASHYSGLLSWYSENDTYHSAMRKTTLPEFLASNVPENVKSVLVPVMKEFYYKEKSEIQTVADTLFLPSSNETNGNFASGFGSEGDQYEYYKAGNSTNIYTTSGSVVEWWTRSPSSDTMKAYFHTFGSGGFKSDKHAATTGLYGVPCMCI